MHHADPACRSRRRWTAVLLLAALLAIATACGSAASDLQSAAVSEDVAVPTTAANTSAAPGVGPSDAAETDAAETDAGQRDPNRADAARLAAAITELPPAQTGLPQPSPPGRQPTGLTIDALGIDGARIIDVGVEANGDMEIPPADQVGWYRYGTAPGASEGSAVLAAHIAFDGRDGVFVELDELEMGSTIVVSFDDGSEAAFVATAMEQYGKNDLPDDIIFARQGDHQLVLITCGGDFNRSLRSYEDNVVVYARPLGSP